MVYYLIVCRSLTYAQRTANLLERAGITARILRVSNAIPGEGCGYAVKVGEQRLSDALVRLHRAGLPPRRVYIVTADGGVREVGL